MQEEDKKAYLPQNAAAALATCEDAVLKDLQRRNAFINVFVPWEDGTYSRNSNFLRYGIQPRHVDIQKLEDYVEASHIPLRYFFYGTTNTVYPTYTEHDEAVIRFLNGLPESSLEFLWEVLQHMFPNKLYNWSYTAKGNKGEYIPFAVRLGYSLRIERNRQNLQKRANKMIVQFPEHNIYQHSVEELRPEFERFLSYGGRVLHKFRDEFLLDFATFAGVSIHWVLQLTSPLYCRTAQAEQIFDYYTTLLPQQQAHFLKLLGYITSSRAYFMPTSETFRKKASL